MYPTRRQKNQVRYVQDLECVSVVYKRSRVSIRRGDENTARYHDNHEEGIKKKKLDVATKKEESKKSVERRK